MITTVSYERLTLPFKSKDAQGKRIYDARVISEYDLNEIRNCIKYALFHSLDKYNNNDYI